ncbi:MAG TPA: hypothetical protein VLQ45_28135 [Thermoanaerobaculia bacterium]|nr:hypothetical protein [Thermoanaerobaculia bacterium]
MRSRSFRLLATVPLLAAVLAVPAAAEIQPVGSEVRVNRNNDFKQRNPVAAFGSSGPALVVWENDQNGIRGRFQRLDGTAASAEMVLVANDTLNGRYEANVRLRMDPAVAALSGGGFLLAWTEERSLMRSAPFYEYREVHDRDIFVQRFDADGSPAGRRYRVNADATGFQAVPKIAVLPNGSAFVVWRATGAVKGITGRFVRPTGEPVGGDVKLTEEATADHAAVAASRNNRVLVTWDSLVGGQEDIFARLIDNTGRVDGPAFRVNSAAAGRQRWPAVATGPDGNFLVAWQSYVTDRVLVRIYGQGVSPAGGFLGSQLLLSTDAGTGQLAPALAPTKTGFVATWLQWSDKGLGIRGVELSATGSRADDEFWVTDDRVQKNYRTSIATNGNGGFLVPWETISRDSTSRGRQVIAARSLRQ